MNPKTNKGRMLREQPIKSTKVQRESAKHYIKSTIFQILQLSLKTHPYLLTKKNCPGHVKTNYPKAIPLCFPNNHNKLYKLSKYQSDRNQQEEDLCRSYEIRTTNLHFM